MNAGSPIGIGRYQYLHQPHTHQYDLPNKSVGKSHDLFSYQRPNMPRRSTDQLLLRAHSVKRAQMLFIAGAISLASISLISITPLILNPVLATIAFLPFAIFAFYCLGQGIDQLMKIRCDSYQTQPAPIVQGKVISDPIRPMR